MYITISQYEVGAQYLGGLHKDNILNLGHCYSIMKA